MATFTTNGPSFGTFDIAALDGNFTYNATATNWRRGPYSVDFGTHVEFQGTGFTYFDGSLSGGTINALTSREGGAISFQITGMSTSAATFNAYQETGDSQGFLTEVFSGNDTITGSAGSDHLNGFAGHDVLEGKGGNDTLEGGAGSDTLIGGEGNDSYVIDSGDTVVETGKSINDLVATYDVSIDLNSTSYDGIEHVRFFGTAALNATGDGENNTIYGNDGANVVSGQAGNDTLFGRDGDDTLDGGTGDDLLNGDDGDDTYTVDSIGDWVHEEFSEGTDTVISSLTSYTLGNHLENLTLTGGAKNGTGNTFDNVLTGNAAANKLDGAAGNDTLIGGDGNDQYRVDSATDKIVETWYGGTADIVMSAVTYKLPDYVESLYLLGSSGIGGTGNDLANVIAGNAGANKISGSGGDDDLYGGSGNDTLIGGEGNDDVYGGPGSDKIDVSLGDDAVHYASSGGIDEISGFDGHATGGQDRLSMVDFFDVLDVDPDDRAERLHISKNGTTINVWVDVDGDKDFDVQVAQINTVDAITIGQDILVTAALP
jgi:Ca2+-binding RTX toxin-like protein